MSFCFLGEESHAAALFALPCCPPRTVDVRLGVVRRLYLDHQIDVREVQASRSDISCDQNLESPLFELSISIFSFKLGYVSMQGLVWLTLATELTR